MVLTKVKEKFQVTIPTNVRKTLRLAVGDLLEAEAKNNAIILKPKAVVDRAAVDAAIAEGLEDIKKGRVLGPFTNAKEAMRALRARAKKR